ncbi:helicase-related protein [Barrientosiimonas endolithica]|uniref:Helicase C-terminal domain-containing protein n=1 Tax=Barrientosiimonas endolithica TaxID=1535208 RepID=A0ABN6YRH7_9MICO|nr:helicase-related protein [Barrientosiimonas endolithica]BDZ59878.1 hypothetical protein GCM10025872_35350 [Barrientosiimonas endolithica]
MTATPSAGDGGLQFDREAEIRAQPEVGDRIRRRADMPVVVEHVEASTGDQGMAQAVSGLTVEPGESYLVFANTPQRAKVLASTLRARHRDAEVVLLVGGMPNTFQKHVLRRLASVRTGEPRRGPETKPLIVVATQTLEVGADLDFDHVLMPIASAAAIIQRLGRVNRVGVRSGGSVRIVVGEGKPEPVYGEAAADLGAALLASAPTTVAELVSILEGPEHAPAPVATAVLPRFVFDSYVSTGRSPYEAPVGRWLRSPDDPAAEVSVAFRRSVAISELWPGRDSVAASAAADNPLVAHLKRHPPHPDETWTVPIALARELCARNPFVLVDPATRMPQLSPPAASLRPGSVVVLPPQSDAFGIEGAGVDLVDGQPSVDDAAPGAAIGRFELAFEPDESRYEGEYEMVELVDEGATRPVGSRSRPLRPTPTRWCSRSRTAWTTTRWTSRRRSENGAPGSRCQRHSPQTWRSRHNVMTRASETKIYSMHCVTDGALTGTTSWNSRRRTSGSPRWLGATGDGCSGSPVCREDGATKPTPSSGSKRRGPLVR